MSRQVRDHKLATRSARDRLKARAEPYWRILGGGLHLGYFKGERTSKWVVRYRAPGSGSAYRKQRLGQTDDFHDSNGETILSFSEAQAAALSWAERHGSGDWRGRYTVAHALDDYERGFRGKSLAKTKSRIEGVIRPILGHIELSKLTSRHIQDWHLGRANTIRPKRLASSDKDAARKARSTANRDLTILKAALNAAFQRGNVASDLAWRRVKPFANAEGVRLRCLTVDECEKIRMACNPAFRPMVEASLLTGARYGELCRVVVEDFDYENATLLLRETKAGGSRRVFLSDEGKRFFAALASGRRGELPLIARPDGRAWTASQQVRLMRAASESAGLEPRVSFHDLRRTYGALLAQAGIPMAFIAEGLGHKDERITRRHYAHLAPSHVAATLRSALNPFGIAPEPSEVKPLTSVSGQT